MLRETFPNFKFSEPATADMLVQAELVLGVPIPEKLKEIYRECDGFSEDKSNAQYLFPLLGSSSLLEITPFLWQEFEDVFPKFSLTGYIFFGSSCCDHYFGINSKAPFNLIQYHHHMEGTWEDHGKDILEMYKGDYCRFDDAGAV